MSLKNNTLFALVLGMFVAAALALVPVNAFAGDGHDHGSDKKCGAEDKCGGEKKCGAEDKCSGDKHEGDEEVDEDAAE